MVLTTYPSLPPVRRREVYRYAGCREATSAMDELLDACLRELDDGIRAAVCYLPVTVTVTGEVCDFGCCQLRSAQLARLLQPCREAVLFCATVGVAIDRLVGKYIAVSPSRAVMLQAMGAERIEALCDAFCETVSGATVRYSPGYGDLPLSAQRELFRVLAPPKHIGVCLTEGLLMSPTKSVTAIVGVR